MACESGFAIPDPSDAAVVWSGCYEGILERFDERTGQARNVSVWPDNPEGWAAGELRDRFQWTFPILISPHDADRVYAGSQRVHVTTNGGQSWEAISPDLTTDDPDLQRKTGGLTFDDVSPTYAAVLFSLAESPHTEGVLWAGSNDGRIQVTRNGGESWEDVSANLPGLPPLGTFSNLEPSRHAAGAAYATVDLHQLGDTNTWAFKTEDFGATWRRLGLDLRQHTHSYAHTLREDPERPGLLFLGTENAVFVSFDDGASFEPLQLNLPRAPVHWLTIQERFSDLVAATYGRGFWILDDLTPIRQWTDAVEASSVHLFRPREAWRFRMRPSPMSQPEDPGAGENPPYGATLHYRLGEDRSEGVEIEIVDAAGEVVRTLAGAGSAGLHRLVWDLRNEPTRAPRLRTPPQGSPHAVLPARGYRLLTESRPVSTLLAPGDYTVRLRSGDETREAPLTVRADPESPNGGRDLLAQIGTLLRIQEMVREVGAMIEAIEWLRKQTGERRALGAAGASGVEVAAGEYESALMELEARFFELRLTGGNAGQDTLRWPRRLHAKLSSLHGYIAGSDHRPTDQHLEVLALHERELEAARERYEQLSGEELAALNEHLVGAGLPPDRPDDSSGRPLKGTPAPHDRRRDRTVRSAGHADHRQRVRERAGRNRDIVGMIGGRPVQDRCPIDFHDAGFALVAAEQPGRGHDGGRSDRRRQDDRLPGDARGGSASLGLTPAVLEHGGRDGEAGPVGGVEQGAARLLGGRPRGEDDQGELDENRRDRSEAGIGVAPASGLVHHADSS